MATNFPTSLDSLSNPSGTTLLNAAAPLTHSSQHANTNDAIEALEAKVGVNTSAVTTSHDYLLRANGIDTCTSGARGTALRTGQIKYETDTLRWIVWDGSAWQRFQWTNAASRTGAAVRRVANQTFTNGTAANISWDTSDFQSESYVTVNATTGTTLTIPSGQSGVYSLSINTVFTGSSFTRVALLPTIAGTVHGANGGSTEPYLSFGWVGPLSAGNTITIQAIQTSGASQTLTGSLWLYRLAI
jgi:hypothetical protein